MHFVQILERKLAVQPFPYYLEYILHIYIYIGFGNILLHSQGVEWTFIIHMGWSGPLSFTGGGWTFIIHRVDLYHSQGGPLSFTGGGVNLYHC